MAETNTPSSIDSYMDGMFELAREAREAREAGNEWAPGWTLAYTQAALARERFISSMDRLAAAPGLSTDEVEQVAAGILALANEGD